MQASSYTVPGIMTVAKVVSKKHLQDEKQDAIYWRKKTFQERLEALEAIRRDYHRWRYGAEPRLQRVYRIVKR